MRAERRVLYDNSILMTYMYRRLCRICDNPECPDILDDGNFVAQYLIEVPSSADYDYIDAGAYYDIRTFIIDVPGGKTNQCHAFNAWH